MKARLPYLLFFALLGLGLFMVLGVFQGRLTFGNGLGDLYLVMVLALIVLAHGILGLVLHVKGRAHHLVGLSLVFLLPYAYFALKASLWRGSEMPWDGKLFVWHPGDARDNEAGVEWGATVTGASEESTVYYVAKREAFTQFGLGSSRFPTNAEAESHVQLGDGVHQVHSRYTEVQEGDSLHYLFSCKVVWDSAAVQYRVEDLKRSFHHGTNGSDALLPDTTQVQLSYQGWGCPCPQWLTAEGRIEFESQDSDAPERRMDLCQHVVPATPEARKQLADLLAAGHTNIRFEGRYFERDRFLEEEGEFERRSPTLLFHHATPAD